MAFLNLIDSSLNITSNAVGNSDSCSLDASTFAVVNDEGSSGTYVEILTIDAAKTITTRTRTQIVASDSSAVAIGALSATEFVACYRIASVLTIKTFTINTSTWAITEDDAYTSLIDANDLRVDVIDSTHFITTQASGSGTYATTYSLDASNVITLVDELRIDFNNSDDQSITVLSPSRVIVAADYLNTTYLWSLSIDGSYNLTLDDTETIASSTFPIVKKLNSTRFIQASGSVIRVCSIDGLGIITIGDTANLSSTYVVGSMQTLNEDIVIFSKNNTSYLDVFTVDGSFNITAAESTNLGFSSNLRNNVAFIDSSSIISTDGVEYRTIGVFSPSAWSNSQLLTIDNTKVAGSADHTDFPVLVTGDQLPSALFSGAQSTGADIRFSSDSAGTIPLDYELVSYDSGTSSAQIWVKIPTLSHNTDTDFYVWWGNSSATSASDGGAVFTDYSAVYHAEDNNDSTANAKNLTETGTVSNLSGSIDNGFDATFSDSTNHLRNTAVYQPSAGAVTISTWFKKTSAPTSDFTPTIISLGESSGSTRVTIESAKTTGYARAQFVNSGTDQLTTTTNISDNTSHYLVVKRTGTSISLLVDGVSVATGTSSKSINGDDFHIGFAGLSTAFDFIGAANIDEVRVRSTYINDDWTLTEYNNQNSPSTFFKAAATNITLTPASLTATSTSVAPVVTATRNATYSATAISSTLTAVVPVTTANQNVTYTAGQITATGTVVSPTIEATRSVTLTPASLALATTKVNPITVVSDSVQPASQSANTSTVEPTISISESYAAATVTATGSVIAPILRVDDSFTATAVSSTATVITPIIEATRNATYSATAIGSTATIQTPSTSTDANTNINATAMVATTSTVAPSVSATQNRTFTATAVQLVTSTVAPTIEATRNVTYSATAISSSATVVTPNTSTDANVNINVSAQSLTTSEITPQIAIDTAYLATALQATTSSVDPTIATVLNVNLTPDTVSATTSIVAPATLVMNPNDAMYHASPLELVGSVTTPRLSGSEACNPSGWYTKQSQNWYNTNTDTWYTKV